MTEQPTPAPIQGEPEPVEAVDAQPEQGETNEPAEEVVQDGE